MTGDAETVAMARHNHALATSHRRPVPRKQRPAAQPWGARCCCRQSQKMAMGQLPPLQELLAIGELHPRNLTGTDALP